MSNLKISQQSVNPLALQICQVLQQAGFQAFIVGGCVRDLILGVSPKDWDITTDASPQQVIDLFPKTIPTGLQHGTVTVVLGEGLQNHFEITTFRVEGEYKDGRRPEEVFFVKDIEQDLARRDLTINAIAFDPINEKLVDPFGGRSDLENHIIKAVGSPIERFTEDGLRIMRAARFAARFGYTIEDETLVAMSECLETLRKVSKERIKDELCKTLMTSDPEIGLNVLISCGALSVALPFLTGLPVRMAMLRVQNVCQGDLETRVAFMYSNCAKIKEAEQDLINLKFSNKEIKQIMFLLDLQHQLIELTKKWSRPAYREFIAHVKNQMGDDWEHTMKEFIKLITPLGFARKDEFLQYHKEIVLSKKEMIINGNDLIAFGIKPGPQIKMILDLCYGEILHKPNNNTREYLLNFVNHFINDQIDPIC
jgi:tRNA nucleotidyltransferase (CCA-adding enzyme)